MNILITGGAGFFGHHLVEHILKTTSHEVIVLDKLSYASRGLSRLAGIDGYDTPQLKILTWDLTSPLSEGMMREIGRPDLIIHAAAETHVDRSVANPRAFIESNVIGTFQILEFARHRLPHLFIYFSTDEVFGPARLGESFHDWDRYNSTNPYAASKAAAEELCLAYANTYDVPMLITHCANLFGERQHGEKFIPKLVRSILEGDEIRILHPCSRSYIHCRNAADCLLYLAAKTWKRDKINIPGQTEIDNLDLARYVADVIGKPGRFVIAGADAARPNHDRRYAMDGSRLEALGWKPPVDFWPALEKTVRWMIEPRNVRWLYD